MVHEICSRSIGLPVGPAIRWECSRAGLSSRARCSEIPKLAGITDC